MVRCRTGLAGVLGGVALLVGGCGSGDAAERADSDSEQLGGDPMANETIHGFTMDRIDGTPQALSEYEGKVVLVVNVASKCGLTPQYAGLEALYEDKRGDGLVVLGFPANNFMGQEPGTNDEIQSFCTSEYGVTFPMFAKISVKGKEQHPLFRQLSAQSEAPSWNFTKYLVGPDGRLVRRFGPRTSPNDAELVAEIDRLLAGG